MRGMSTGLRGLAGFSVGMRGAAPRPRNVERALKAERSFTERLIASGARHIIDFADARSNGRRYIPNRATGKTPARNLISFPTGPIVNESGASTPTKTNASTVNTDPSGVTNRATRLVATATNQGHLFYQQSSCPQIPSGVYGLRFRARIPTGGASFTLSYGLSTALTTKLVQDLDWSNSANDVATTFDVEFTYAGTGDIQIRLPAVGNDMLIDRIQCYQGGLAAIPTWAAEAAALAGGGVKPPFSFDNAIPIDFQGSWSQADGGGGMILREPGLDDFTYSAMTVMVVASCDDYDPGSSIQYVFASQADTRLGSTVNSFHLGFEGTAAPPNQGHVKYAPTTAIRAQTLLSAKGHGSIVYGQGVSASGRRMYMDEIPILTETTAFVPVTQTHWRLGSASTATRAFLQASENVGKVSMLIVWPRQLSDDEWAYWARILKARVDARGVAMAAFKDFHVFSGDSNWTKADGDWLQLIEAPDNFAPAPNVWGRDTAVGGTGIAEVWGASPYPAAMSATGRLATTETQIALAAAKAGHKVCYHFGVGTNDFFEIDGIPLWGTAAYDATRAAVVRYLLNLHPNISVLEYTIIAAGSGSGRNYSSATRLTVNANIRARVAADTTHRLFLCDIGAEPSLGDQATADVGTYLVEAAPGGIHYNGSGDVLAAAFVKPVIQAWRSAMGLYI